VKQAIGYFLAYWYSRAWCALDGHQWMPTSTGARVCVRPACKSEVPA